MHSKECKNTFSFTLHLQNTQITHNEWTDHKLTGTSFF